MRPKKIISGGQTGVDRAALDYAIENKIPHGGYCPKGRLAEDGPLPQCYQLTETKSPHYEERTEKNVLESDGTLILDYGELAGGTLFTANLCQKHKKPLLIIDLGGDFQKSQQRFHSWLEENNIETLNVAGSRESKHPVHDKAKACLKQLFNAGG